MPKNETENAKVEAKEVKMSDNDVGDTICCRNPVFEDMTLWGRIGRRCLCCGETWTREYRGDANGERSDC